MSTLSKDLRKQLEKAVTEARTIAEQGAEQSLHRLAIGMPRPHDALNDDEKKLRVTLRAHAKQLGDRLDQRPAHLIQAVAYEHWHRLLFSRFLIENDLLLHPEHGVALSLDEVKEIALDENREWVEVAADYAQRMLLKSVFQPDDPALSVPLPPEKRQQMEQKLNGLPREVFMADDSLGWVYQFWQRDEWDRINKSETKIGADELPAVTQLFTEDYMVLFLLENTLGAWWTAKRSAEGKDPKLPGYAWTYLRLNEDGSPAAGQFDTWPRTVRELRVLDPCMGSGHFLVFALPILTRMRMEEEALSTKEAAIAVLRDNLFGLEIDGRCAQIAAFNLALASWRLAGRHFPIPQMNLACSGLGINASEADWIRLAGNDGPAREEMRRLYSLFKEAPTLGSLIDPLRLEATLITAGAAKVLPLIEEALQQEQTDESRELAIAARGVLAAFRILAARFTLVATNVPYLGRGKQAPSLAKYCAEFHSAAKADLATCFVDRALRACDPGGSTALVSQQNWWFLGSYKKFRRSLLTEIQLQTIVALGEEAWQTFGDRGPVAALMIATKDRPGPDQAMIALDALPCPTIEEKISLIRDGDLRRILQSDQYGNPDHRITTDQPTKGPLLQEFANSYQGISPADFPHYGREFWEVLDYNDWKFWQSAVEETKLYGGRSLVLWWNADLQNAVDAGQAFLRGEKAWGQFGVACRQMRVLSCCLYSGEVFDTNTAVIIPNDPDHLLAIWAFCSSEEFGRAVRRIDKKVNVTNASIVKVPFDLTHWRRVAAERYPSGLPKPYSQSPTQWIFSGHPRNSDHALNVAVARLLGYRWPRQTGSNFADCPEIGPDGLEPHADADGIVPLSSLAGEASAADRLRTLLADVFGADWSARKLAELVGDCESLEVWLRDRFFEEHCRIFNQRPFIWHVWDGLKDGFHVFVNCHKLNYKTLEKLIYSTLGDWISRQRQDVANGIEGADRRLAAAEHLQNELKNILEGESPYDIFVRWKPLKEQSLGWNPDLNDGIRLNIRPWITAAKLYRATKPGILRVTPNIKYGKDRGKEAARDPEEFPWFGEAGDRNNDIHLTLEDKRKARGLA